MKKCTVDNCDRRYYAKDYCRKHYACYHRTGNPYPTNFRQPKICTARGCGRKDIHAKGYCVKHYWRLRKNGSPYITRVGDNKGSKNGNWNGGVFDYPNHYLMKKNRLIILKRHPICEKCPKPATEVHHRNGDKSDHRLRNLMASCHPCNTKIRFGPNKLHTSKYRRLFGFSSIEFRKFGIHPYQLEFIIKNNIPLVERS